MSYRTLYDLMDVYEDDEVEFAGGPVSVARVRALTMERLRPQLADGPAQGQKARPVRRTLRIALVAAAVLAALSVTAYAVYRAQIKDYLLPAPEPSATETAGTVQDVSVVGYQGTPEYEAFAKWKTWQEEHPWQQYAPEGNDESDYGEGDYHPLYGAFYTEQGEMLDAILEEYGLTPHTDRAGFMQAQELCDILGMELFLGDMFSSTGGYIYDDGAFRADCQLTWDNVWATMFVSVKGSFSQIYSGVDLSESYEEWDYTIASGETIHLVLAANKSIILEETEGAYIYLDVDTGAKNSYDPEKDVMLSPEQKEFYLEGWAMVHPEAAEEELEAAWQDYYDDWVRQAYELLPTPIGKKDLEALADDIDFAVLAARFDGTTRPETAQRVESWREASLADADQRIEEDTAAAQARDQAFYDSMGVYNLGELPERLAGSDMLVDCPAELNQTVFWTEQTGFDLVTRLYSAGDIPELVTLAWFRFDDMASAFADAKVFYGGDSSFDLCEVNGHEGFTTTGTIASAIMWADPDSGLIFSLSAENTPVTVEELVTMAESVGLE